jgi:hypothetical protein
MVWLRMSNNRFISIWVFYIGENVVLLLSADHWFMSSSHTNPLFWNDYGVMEGFFSSPKRNLFGLKVILYFILAVVWNLQLFYGNIEFSVCILSYKNGYRVK